MGVSIEVHRQRIGRFAGGDPGRQRKGRDAAILVVIGMNTNISLAVKLCLASLLVISGNVERNPGPPKLRSTDSDGITKEDIAGLHSKLDTLLSDTKVMNTKLDGMQARLNNIEEDVNDIQQQMKEESDRITALEKLKTDVSSLRSNFESLNHDRSSESDNPTGVNPKLDRMQKTIDSLVKEKDDMDNRSRRNNLIFFGVPGIETETWSESERKVKSIIGERLEINDDIPFDRVHRIVNAPDVRGSKPIVARFCNYKAREMVLSKASKFKGSNMSVGEDFSKRIRLIRAKLFNHRSSMIAGNSKLKAVLRYDKLVVTDEKGKKSRYKVDEDTGHVVEIIP